MPPSLYSKEDQSCQLATSPTVSYYSDRANHFPYFPAHVSNIFVTDFQDHVDPYNQIFNRGVLISNIPPPDSQRMECRSNLFHSNFTDSTRLMYNQSPLSDTIHDGGKVEESIATQSLKNSKFAGNVNRMAIEFQLANENVGATSFQAQSINQGVKKLEEVNDIVTTPNTNTKNHSDLSAYIPDEFVYYDEFENHIDNGSDDPVKFLSTHQGLNEVDKSQCPPLEGILSRTDITSLKKNSKVSNLPISNQKWTITQTAQVLQKPEHVSLLGLNSYKAPHIASYKTSKEGIRTSSCLYALRPKKIRRAFKKILPTENVEQFLSNPESLSYDDLYHKTTTVASLMVELQDEARMIDKELKDFEVAKKSNYQISIEEAKLEKEIKQRDEDIIFDALLKRYGNLTKLSADDWTSFLKSFYDIHVDENPENYRLLLQLRNHQFIQDFQKRKNCREKAKLKANTIRLAETVDSPPTKMEQKAMEDSDRRKRWPAIDPLIFEDRKMADVYGLTHKNGDAFIGNQPLRERYGISKDSSNTKNTDDNFRPKRARGRRGNNDTDHSDHTPVVSDAEDVTPSKRARVNRSGIDSVATSRTGAKTAPSSRESSPSAGPKIFASGKRVGRPPGSSKGQVKLPSKLKSVQAVGETIQTNLDGEKEDVARVETNNLISRLYVDKNSYVICSSNENNNV